jgi:hypothetical protein
MENDAWRLYRPVLTIIFVGPIGSADAVRVEGAQAIVMNYLRSYTNRPPNGDARRQKKSGTVAKPYVVHPCGERYRSGPSIN